ncbi:MAG: Ig-like domain repeat protein, partial [Acidobacteria bacterium Pan2503]|nr:Ig-like domain repeat protein [Candidatus Acidoferrum panamensis]
TSTTAVSASPNPATFGQTVTLAATVQPSVGSSISGTVTFLDGSTTLGTATLSSNAAQLTVSSLALGSHTIAAVYGGNTNFAGSTSAALTETVSQAPTTVTITSSLNPATFGQGVPFVATVQPSSGGAVTGSVTFYDGTSVLATASVVNNNSQHNVVQLLAAGLLGGTHSITVVYSGDANYTGSTSSALTETVNPASSTTSIAVSQNPATFGQAVTLTASVTPSIGGDQASGAVTFYDGTTPLGAANLSNNSAQFSVSPFAVGSHSLTAKYAGDANFAGSTSSVLSETVNQSSTTTTLVSNLNPAVFGQAVPFVATVQPASGGAVTGSVTFYDGTNVLGTASVVNNNNQQNIAQLTAAGLLGGTHSITAVYSGDANYTGSTSSALTETVNAASSTVSIATSQNPATFGQSITLTASVTPSISGDQASGTVTFYDGVTSLGAANLSSNSAQLSVSNLAIGSHSITAKYAGDANFAGSTSPALSETVNPVTTTTALASSLNPASAGQGVAFTATVQAGAGNSATGTVTFLDGSATLGTATLSSGSAQFTTSSLALGSHSITAVYGGSTNFASSTSAALSQTINQVTTTTTLVSGLNPAPAGQSVTFTATVQAGAGNSATGIVTFLDGSTTLDTAIVSSGSAQFATSSLAPGSHSLSAVYGGSTDFAGSTSAVLTETVNQITTTTTLASSVNPALAGQSVTFTATVQAGAGNSATGTITFLDGSTTLGTASVSNNSAQFTTTTLAAGSHAITAAYGGSTNFVGSTSSALTETVNQSSTTTTLVSSLN